MIQITALYIVLSILLFGILILIHECGHYLTARLFKVTINEFAIGMGPKLVSKKSKKTGIAYSLRAFPIGGFVSMAGEDEESDDANAFCNKPVWQRMIITVAGAAVNIIFGIVIMCVCVSCSKGIGSTVVYDFNSPDALSAEAGLMKDDRITEVNGTNVHIATQLGYEIVRNGIEPVDLTVERDGKEIVLEDVEFPKSADGKFGTLDFVVYGVEKSFGNVVKASFYESTNSIKMIWESLYDLVRGRYGINEISGPVGVTEALVETGTNGSFIDFLYLGVVISMNLGVMNLLPIPALDGGRLLFQLVELVTRKRLSTKVEGMIHFVGFVLLMILTVFIFGKDIIGLFR